MDETSQTTISESSADSGAESFRSAASIKPPPVSSRRITKLLWRTAMFPVKLLWGMIFCQGLAGSILVVGWVNRLTQRGALKYWWTQRAQSARHINLDEFMGGDSTEPDRRRWPNWFVDASFAEKGRAYSTTSPARYVWMMTKALFSSLSLNFKIGFQAALNTAVLMLPAGMFWWFGWYDGWNNSFNKGYEQAATGPLISILGIFLFIAAMFYLPMAQARQAITGQWRSFYEFHIVWKVVRFKWLASTGLALLYATLSVPVMVFKIFPVFALQKNPALADLSGPEIIKYLDSYFFWRALWILPAYALVKWVGGRTYASGLLKLTQLGALPFSSLAENEARAMARLGLFEKKPEAGRHAFVRILAWAGTRFGRIVTAMLLVFIWFLFVAQIYIAEFFSYHGSVAWLNQPLIHVPWFHYLPSRLKPPIEEVIFLGLVLLLILACSILARTGRALRNAFAPANKS